MEPVEDTNYILTYADVEGDPELEQIYWRQEQIALLTRDLLNPQKRDIDSLTLLELIRNRS